jgi:hypothetical protein
VSFDVFFQGFLAGEPSERGGAQMREVLAPHVSEEDRTFLRVRVGDGEAGKDVGRAVDKLIRVSDLLGADEILLATTAQGPWKEGEPERLLKATAGYRWRFGKVPQV